MTQEAEATPETPKVEEETGDPEAIHPPSKWGSLLIPQISMTKEQKKALILKSTITGPLGQTSKQKPRAPPIYVPNEWEYMDPADHTIKDRLTMDESFVDNKFVQHCKIRERPDKYQRIVSCRNTHKYDHNIVEAKQAVCAPLPPEEKKEKVFETKYFCPLIDPLSLSHIAEYDADKFLELMERCSRKRKADVAAGFSYFYNQEEEHVCIVIPPALEEAVVKGNIYNVFLNSTGDKITIQVKRGAELKLRTDTIDGTKFPSLVESGHYKEGQGDPDEVGAQKPLTMKEAKRKKAIDAARAKRWIDEEDRQCALIAAGDCDIHKLVDDSEIDINQLIMTKKIDLQKLAMDGIINLHRLIDGEEIDVRKLIETKVLCLKDLMERDKINLQQLLDEGRLDINALIKAEFVNIQELIITGQIEVYKLMKEYKIDLPKLMEEKLVDIQECLYTNSLDITTLATDFKFKFTDLILDDKVDIQKLVDDGKCGLSHLCLNDINGFDTAPLNLAILVRKGKLNLKGLLQDETFNLMELVLNDRLNFQELIDTEVLDLEELIWTDAIDIQQLVLDNKFDFHPFIIDGRFDFALMLEMGKVFLEELYEHDKTSSKRLHKCLGKIGLEENHIKALLGEKLPTPPPGSKGAGPQAPKVEKLADDAKALKDLLDAGKPFTIDDLRKICKSDIGKEALLLLLQSGNEVCTAMLIELIQPDADGNPPACAALLGQIMKPPKTPEQMIELLKDPEAALKLLATAAKRVKAPGSAPLGPGGKPIDPIKEAKTDKLLMTILSTGVEGAAKELPKDLILEIVKDEPKKQEEIKQQSIEMARFLSTAACLMSSSNSEQMNALKEYMLAGSRMSKRASEALEPVFGKDDAGKSNLLAADKFKVLLCPPEKKKTNPLFTFEQFAKATKDDVGKHTGIGESMITGLLVMQHRSRGKPPSQEPGPADIMSQFFTREAARKDPKSKESLSKMWSADATRFAANTAIGCGGKGTVDPVDALRKLIRGLGKKKSSGGKKKKSSAGTQKTSSAKSSGAGPKSSARSQKLSSAGSYNPRGDTSYMADDIDIPMKEGDGEGAVSAKTSYERSRYLRKRSHLLNDIFDDTNGVFLRQQYRI